MPKLAPFDPSKSFIVHTIGLRVFGTVYQRGDAFDPSGVSDRLFRMLYEQRKICYGDAPLKLAPLMIKSAPPVKPEIERHGSKASIEAQAAELARTTSKNELLAMAKEAGVAADRSTVKILIARDLVLATANGAS